MNTIQCIYPDRDAVLAGYLYDIYGYYTPAFATGVAFNIANIAILFMLLVRQRTYSYIR